MPVSSAGRKGTGHDGTEGGDRACTIMAGFSFKTIRGLEPAEDFLISAATDSSCMAGDVGTGSMSKSLAATNDSSIDSTSRVVGLQCLS